jgi:hypothetical protein
VNKPRLDCTLIHLGSFSPYPQLRFSLAAGIARRDLDEAVMASHRAASIHTRVATNPSNPTAAARSIQRSIGSMHCLRQIPA